MGETPTGEDAGGGTLRGIVSLCGTPPLSGAGDGSLNVGTSEVAGKAEKGPSWMMLKLLAPRLIGGLPRVLPVPPAALGRQAEETTFAPWRLLLALDGVMADLGSSAQKAPLVEGVMAEWGCGYAVNGVAVSGVCTISLLAHGSADG